MGLLGTATLRAGGAGGLNVKFNKQTVAGGARAGQRRRTRRPHPHEMFSFCCLVFTFHINIFTTASMLRSHCMFTSQLLFREVQRAAMARRLPQTTRYFNQKLKKVFVATEPEHDLFLTLTTTTAPSQCKVKH